MDENDLIRRELAKAILEAKADASALSRKIGRSKDYLGDFFRGKKRSIGHAELIKLRDLLRIDDERIVEFRKSDFEVLPDEKPVHLMLPRISVSEAKAIPLYAAAEGGEGSIILSDGEIGRVPRPQELESVKEAYAILIEGESMDPVFEPGDIAWVNPLLGARRNHDVVIYGGFKEGAEPRALIKRVVSYTDDRFTLKQYNPARQFDVDRAAWGICHRVIGKLYKR